MYERRRDRTLDDDRRLLARLVHEQLCGHGAEEPCVAPFAEWDAEQIAAKLEQAGFRRQRRGDFQAGPESAPA